jgi:Tfp pilus assembly protein PilX
MTPTLTLNGYGYPCGGLIDARQSGAALITSLIFLTILTILGMSTLGTALLESRMAGNSRDRNLAFQAAEMGLRDAERYIRDSGRIVGHIEVGYLPCSIADVAAGLCDEQKCKHGLCYNGIGMDGGGDANAWFMTNKAVWQDSLKWRNALQYAHDESVAGLAGTKIVGDGLVSIDVLNGETGQCTAIPGDCNYSQPTLLPLVGRQPEYLIEPFQKPVAGETTPHYFYRITVRGYGMRSGTRVMLQEIYRP